jgi:hypothetical protein
VWQTLVLPGRFKGLALEDLRTWIGQQARSSIPSWVAYLEQRYGWQ